MLKLLLDEHVALAVAAGVRHRHPSLIVVCLAEWENGEFLGQPPATLHRSLNLDSIPRLRTLCAELHHKIDHHWFALGMIPESPRSQFRL